MNIIHVHVVRNSVKGMYIHNAGIPYSGKLKNSPIGLNACTPMAVSIQIAKFILRQYQWRASSPNLMLVKVIPLYSIL